VFEARAVGALVTTVREGDPGVWRGEEDRPKEAKARPRERILDVDVWVLLTDREAEGGGAGERTPRMGRAARSPSVSLLVLANGRGSTCLSSSPLPSRRSSRLLAPSNSNGNLPPEPFAASLPSHPPHRSRA
jgi:hypothetical protein